MRRMRIVSALVAVAMLGTTVIPAYAAELGTYAELTEENIEAVTSGEVKVQAFVERMYTKALGRAADAAGVAYWTNTLLNKEKTAAEVGYGFIFSEEYKNKNTSDAEFVEMLYNVFMDRASDIEGKNHWMGLLEKGYSRRYVYRKFAHSEEYTQICKGYGITRGVITLVSERDLNPNLTEYVGRLYSKALDRHPDDAGMNWWCTNIKNYTMTPVAAAESFILSPEFEAKNLSNEEYIKVLYRTFMGREYNQDGLNYWLGRINSGESRRTILRSFAGCQEFQNIVAKTGISEETVTLYDHSKGHLITYRPSDYYLSWDYICDQVNAMLKSDYPNAIIARGITYNGVYYESGWDAGDEWDGYAENRWTNESRIDDFYSSIKRCLVNSNAPSDAYMAIGMFVESITVEADGCRRIYITCYH